jgi:hypothetical protein
VCGGQVAGCTVETSIFNLGNGGEGTPPGVAIISYESSFQDCKIEDMKLCQASKFHACQLERCEDEGREHTSSPLSFRNFPAEIREHIIKSAFEQRYGNKREAPFSRDEGYFATLIIALRGFPLFYNEALDVWYKNLVFYLHEKDRCEKPGGKYDNKRWGYYAGLPYDPRIDPGLKVFRRIERLGIP